MMDPLRRILCGVLLLLSQGVWSAPDLLLAKTYSEPENIQDYWVSEKLDGVRAYWNGKQLISRQGNVFVAPPWFTRDFPDVPLDGELWIARNAFEQTLSTVKKRQPIDDQWRQMSYQIFELPNAEGTFSQRLAVIQRLVHQANSPYLQYVKQQRLPSLSALQDLLDKVTAGGGEGLMLHYADSLYSAGRSDHLMKLKKYQDAEAVVVAHLPGKGKHQGRLGALLVEMPNGQQFKIGTGFTDAQREQPPAIGSTVTYKFYGLSKKGIPKFASFMRVREAE